MNVTSTSETQAISQSAWKQLQLDQARQFAERAAQNARALQAKASAAQSVANHAQESARTLKVEANQAQGVAVQADRNVRSTESYNQIGPQVLTRVTQAAEAQTAAPAQTQPTVNTQGETIGTVINVTA